MTQNDLKGFRFRESTRAPFETEVKLRFDRFGGAVSGYSADISMEGMFVRTAEPKPVGTLVQFEFSLGQDGELIQGLGDVVWVRTRQLAADKPSGMGIQFRYIDPHSRELIVKIVDRYLKETKQEGGTQAVATPGARATASSPTSPSAPPPPAAAAPPTAAPPSAAIPPAPPPPAAAAPPTAAPPPTAMPPASPPPPARDVPELAQPPDVADDLPGSDAVASAPAQPRVETGSPSAVESSPPVPSSRGRGGDELFVPDEAWDPVAAAARAIEPPSFSAATPAPRPTYAGGAGIARPSRGRRWAVPVVIVLVAGLGAAGFVFREELLGLLPGSTEEALPMATADAESGSPPAEVGAAPVVTDAHPAIDGTDEPAAAGDTEPSAPLDTTADLVTPPQRDGGEVESTRSSEPVVERGEPVTLVEEIRSWQRAGETVVTIEGNGELREGDFSELRLDSPPRLVVKIFGIEEGYRPLTAVDSPELRQIRTALHQGNELHVVLDLRVPDVEASVGIESGRLRIRLQR